MPSDDTTWPDCSVHPDDNSPGAQVAHHWCDWTREYLVKGLDAEEIRFDMGSLAVPMVPKHDLYAEVTIGEEVIPGLSYMLKLVVPKDSQPFAMPDDDDMIDLGLYTRGEGRLVMATAINDWASSYDGECKATTHGFPEEMLVQGAQNANDVQMLKAIKWCIAYYKKCYFCNIKSQQNTGVAPVPDFSASSFGVNPDDFRGGNRPPANARQNRARDALRSRYGNRVMAGQDPTDLGNNSWPGAQF
jgi:hypothetical protein